MCTKRRDMSTHQLSFKDGYNALSLTCLGVTMSIKMDGPVRYIMATPKKSIIYNLHCPERSLLIKLKVGIRGEVGAAWGESADKVSKKFSKIKV